jgi:hypothetical protein
LDAILLRSAVWLGLEAVTEARHVARVITFGTDCASDSGVPLSI